MSTETDQPFVVEEILSILKEVVEDQLQQGTVYQHKQVPQWTQGIIDNSLKKISELNKSYKYIVNCVIFQKTGAGFHTASSCLWDSSNDNSCSYKFENKTMYCITSVFGCKI
ncbi:hypothetical protein DICPUDRAFT_80662 [Dictyostelium purpureum]|uniref:Dynein light chain Tctex-type n=1 Tax=Dictyostelium purpureum TaxID=5786 RepID=F0ZR59_DICPU|nr:uncharacterized protein DICPUDRAFT_80662 [Dictyostelium purpureum]EGC33579.1 hypothetical protein DICPUDRAFT_80662 [Dictyostelium purpureum]|eukprot:XP_003289894.1 hypothetical protein DICPUDRAFT_80662 [Dictyostelium purpureum]